MIWFGYEPFGYFWCIRKEKYLNLSGSVLPTPHGGCQNVLAKRFKVWSIRAPKVSSSFSFEVLLYAYLMTSWFLLVFNGHQISPFNSCLLPCLEQLPELWALISSFTIAYSWPSDPQILVLTTRSPFWHTRSTL